MWLSFIACAVIMLAIILNFHAYQDYKRYSQTALRTYSDTSLRHKILRIFCLIGFILFMTAFFYICFFTEWSLQETFAVLALALLLALFAFVPFSSSLWTMNDKGIYIYRARRFIPWSQIIRTGIQTNRKTTYLTLQVKKEAGEVLKRIYYAVIIPPEDGDEVRNIIREFLHALDKQRYYKNRQDEKKVELKDRKWY